MIKLTNKIALEAAITALYANDRKEYRVEGTENTFATKDIIMKLLDMIVDEEGL